MRRRPFTEEIQMQWFLVLHPVLQSFLASLFMYGMTALGASSVFFVRRCNALLFSLLTGAAAGIMIAASFFSLLLPAMEYESALPPLVPVLIGFVAGGGLIVLFDHILSLRLSKAHGSPACALMYFAVSLHNLPEGLAVGVAFAQGAGAAGGAAAMLLAFGIAIQNFPEGMCVAFPLRTHGMSAKKSFVLAQASGAVEVFSCTLGAAAAALIAGLMPWALAFSAGAMIAVVCSELIPASFEGHKMLASVGFVAGFALMMALDLALS